jgi:lipopolysaccharide export system protein LptC
MSVAPLQAPRRTRGAAGARHRLSTHSPRIRAALTPARIARRRTMVVWSKWVLPLLALLLLGAVALYPEFDRTRDRARVAFHRVSAEVEGSKMIEPHYRGLDERGRPYTITAATAEQVSADRVNMTDPKGDITLENGTWMQVQSKDGVYIQKANQLDLSNDVFVYRDDGVTMHTPAASLDLKAGAGAGSEPVHAEGPFGTLDAQDGFSIVDRGDVIRFNGPSRVVLNGDTP